MEFYFLLQNFAGIYVTRDTVWGKMNLGNLTLVWCQLLFSDLFQLPQVASWLKWLSSGFCFLDKAGAVGEKPQSRRRKPRLRTFLLRRAYTLNSCGCGWCCLRKKRSDQKKWTRFVMWVEVTARKTKLRCHCFPVTKSTKPQPTSVWPHTGWRHRHRSDTKRLNPMNQIYLDRSRMIIFRINEFFF